MKSFIISPSMLHIVHPHSVFRPGDPGFSHVHHVFFPFSPFLRNTTTISFPVIVFLTSIFWFFSSISLRRPSIIFCFFVGNCTVFCSWDCRYPDPPTWGGSMSWRFATIWKWHICVCDFHIIRHLLCGLREEEPQTAHLMSITWASHIAASVLTDVKLLPNQSIYKGTEFHFTK